MVTLPPMQGGMKGRVFTCFAMDVRKVVNTFSLGVGLLAGYGFALLLIAPLWRCRWTGRELKVGGLLCCMERVLRLAWEDFALVPLFITSGTNDMICSIVTLHARKRLSWLKLSGRFGLEVTSSAWARVCLLCIDGIYTHRVIVVNSVLFCRLFSEFVCLLLSVHS